MSTVEKWVDKPVILKTIDANRALRTSRLESPWRSPEVPQPKSPSSIHAANTCASVAFSTFVDHLSLKDEGEDV